MKREAMIRLVILLASVALGYALQQLVMKGLC